MNTRRYLDRCRRLTESGSDYAVAKLLGVSEDAINGYRTGRRCMDNNTCRKIAETLGVPLVDVIVAAEIERAKNAQDRAAWRKWLKRSVRVALVAGLVVADAVYFPATGNHLTVVANAEASFFEMHR
jgi:predicted transcriptional regulator